VPARGVGALGVCPHHFTTAAARADLYRQPTIMSFSFFKLRPLTSLARSHAPDVDVTGTIKRASYRGQHWLLNWTPLHSEALLLMLQD